MINLNAKFKSVITIQLYIKVRSSGFKSGDTIGARRESQTQATIRIDRMASKRGIKKRHLRLKMNRNNQNLLIL